MRHRFQAALIALFGVLLAALPALAHHSFTAEFNPDKEWSATGVLTKVEIERRQAFEAQLQGNLDDRPIVPRQRLARGIDPSLPE